MSPRVIAPASPVVEGELQPSKEFTNMVPAFLCSTSARAVLISHFCLQVKYLADLWTVAVRCLNRPSVDSIFKQSMELLFERLQDEKLWMGASLSVHLYTR